ncbi:hypothetical protein GH714_000076 [Hevea brasiliensis]|uniref:Uncharacterized protein n=1 Tax=Hevea brasiliensis TaxID=3981 RepID=A0A6A6M5U1_HEVBR|nr:hypothetical protein GH714_000076 [Hevea brasiliensis]
MHGAPGSRVIVTTRDEAIARMMKTIQSHNLNCISNEDCWSLFLDHAFASRSVADADIKLKVIREKRCFAYCAILPKDYVFQKKQLVLLWMAEGLIEQGDRMEDVGEEYFQDLCSRSLFQSSSNGGFMMHDLVNDVAKVVVGDTCFRLEDELTASNKEKARHSSYIPGLVLSFKYYNITELPDSIGDLKHLRYLDLSYTDIVTLPETTTSLCNLQTLLLNGCYRLNKLPSEMQNLIKLRHLDMENTYAGMPQGIEALKSLRILSDFVVGKGNEEVGITALMNLKFLQGALRISRLDNVSNASDVRGAILLDKERIDYLVMEDGDRGVLEMMKPHGNLKNLTIWNYGGQSPASLKDLVIDSFRPARKVCAKLEWIAERFDNNTSLESIKIGCLPYLKSLPENLHMLTNLHSFRIHKCPSFVSFPQGGLPIVHLKSLKIIECEKFEVLPDNMHNLTSLQELTIKNCPSVVSFSEGGLPTTHFKELTVEDCAKLETLPDNIHNLTSLQNLTLKSCPVSFPEEGFPINLTSLCIDKVEICNPRLIGVCTGSPLSTTSVLQVDVLGRLGARNTKWPSTVLGRLTSLEKVSIKRGCPGVVSFPQDELPASLTALHIKGFEDLKYLSNRGFESLSSIEFLILDSCPKLASFPKNGLPPSLLQLCIRNCPVLQQRCEKGKGQESLEVARIPYVEFE